jgi:ABC-2 type transport system ATP-binding protein
MPVIETDRLVKKYKQVTALKGVQLSVERGQIYGLLGRNGAGKTTLVKILLGIVKPTEGEAFLLEAPVGTVRVRRRVGYLPEDHRFPEYHTGWSLLDYYGALLGLSRAERHARIPRLLDLAGIANRMHSKIRTYSKGMKQRLGIAQAILHDPEVLFLDEPTDGVDPVGRREIREVLQRLKDEGKTIFLNSHLLSEVEMVTDRVGIMELGELVREGDIESLTVQKGRYQVGLARGQEFPADELRNRGYKVSLAREELWEVGLVGDLSIDPVVELLHARGLNLRHLVEKRQSLEDIFLATIQPVAVEVVQ